MVELIVGTYGVLCWLLFKKFKVIPVTTYSVVTAFLGGGVILLMLYIFLSVFHPVSHDGRMYAPVVQIVPNVRGTVIEVPVQANVPVGKGDVLFKIDSEPFQIEVDRLRALLASKNTKFAQLERTTRGGRGYDQGGQGQPGGVRVPVRPAGARELRAGGRAGRPGGQAA